MRVIELITEYSVDIHEVIDSQTLVRLVACCGAGWGDSPALLPAQPEPITAMAMTAVVPIAAPARRARSPDVLINCQPRTAIQTVGWRGLSFCSHFLTIVLVIELITEYSVDIHEVIDSQTLVRLVACCGAGWGDSPALLPAQPEPITAMAMTAVVPIAAPARRARSPDVLMTT